MSLGIFSGVFLLFGSLTVLLSSIGLLRFTDIYLRTRMAVGGTTFGAMGILFAFALSDGQPALYFRAVVWAVFLAVSAAVATTLLYRIAEANDRKTSSSMENADIREDRLV